MNNIIKVGMADLNVCGDPGMITTIGLGSCVGIALYERFNKIIGLAHIMLPSSLNIRNNNNISKFADTAIDKLIDDMMKIGAKREFITAKLAGGAQMFSINQTSDLMRIGQRNVIATKEKLSELKIPIVSEDTGGNFGRTIEFYSDEGRLFIKTIGHGVKNI